MTHDEMVKELENIKRDGVRSAAQLKIVMKDLGIEEEADLSSGSMKSIIELHAEEMAKDSAMKEPEKQTTGDSHVANKLARPSTP